MLFRFGSWSSVTWLFCSADSLQQKSEKPTYAHTREKIFKFCLLNWNYDGGGQILNTWIQIHKTHTPQFPFFFTLHISFPAKSVPNQNKSIKERKKEEEFRLFILTSSAQFTKINTHVKRAYYQEFLTVYLFRLHLQLGHCPVRRKDSVSCVKIPKKITFSL